jgi:hypothetical protein
VRCTLHHAHGYPTRIGGHFLSSIDRIARCHAPWLSRRQRCNAARSPPERVRVLPGGDCDFDSDSVATVGGMRVSRCTQKSGLVSSARQGRAQMSALGQKVESRHYLLSNLRLLRSRRPSRSAPIGSWPRVCAGTL